ncbi:MAG: NUDIX domain-containing protein [Ectobacillus sp.]
MNELYKKKVYAYVTREKEGKLQLLVYANYDNPDAGLQVPGGSVEHGETLVSALLRDILEESGLNNVKIEKTIADELIHVKEKNEYQQRYFCHATLTADVKDEWLHTVTSGEDNGHVFQFKWIDADQCTALIENQGAYVHLLKTIPQA